MWRWYDTGEVHVYELRRYLTQSLSTAVYYILKQSYSFWVSIMTMIVSLATIFFVITNHSVGTEECWFIQTRGCSPLRPYREHSRRVSRMRR